MTVLDPAVLVGQRVREARALAGLTQAELARRLDCPTSTIGRIETGARAVSLATLFALADRLGVEASALVSLRPVEVPRGQRKK